MVVETAAAPEFSDDERAAVKWYESETGYNFYSRRNGNLTFTGRKGRQSHVTLVYLMWAYRMDQRTRSAK